MWDNNLKMGKSSMLKNISVMFFYKVIMGNSHYRILSLPIPIRCGECNSLLIPIDNNKPHWQ